MSSQGAVEGRPPKAPLGGRLAWWPFAGALVGVAVVVAVIVLVGGGTTGSRQGGTGLTSSGAVACPEFFEDADATAARNVPWVPAKPAGVASPRKMVPTLHPTHVTVCEYLSRVARPPSLRLSGQRELVGKLDRVVDTLRRLPAPPAGARPCSTPAVPETATNYLIGLRYDEAIVWVSAPVNPCLGSTNGVFHSARNVSALAAASYAARTWVADPG